MKRKVWLIAAIAFLSIVLLNLACTVDFATSVIPGWHTTIYPPWYIGSIIVVSGLLLFLLLKVFWPNKKKS